MTPSIFGLPQHPPPKIGLSSQKGETLGIFFCALTLSSKIMHFWGREELPVFFLYLNFILQNLGFLLKRERLLVLFVCRSIIFQNSGFLLGRERLSVFFLRLNFILQYFGFLLNCLFTFLHSLFLQNKSTLCTLFSCNILMSHTFFITLLPILQPKHNMSVLSLLFFPVQQSNSVIWLQQIIMMYSWILHSCISLSFL